MWKFHSSAGGRDSWQQVIPLRIVSETHNQFVHNLVLAHRSGYGRHCGVFWDLVYEMLAIKLADLLPAKAPGHDRHAVHIWFGDHCFHCCINIKIGKLSCNVPVEERTEVNPLGAD